MDLKDLSLPEGWSCSTRAGWATLLALGGITAPSPEMVDVRNRLRIPRTFELLVEYPRENKNGTDTAVLEFVVRDNKEIRLAAVLSLDDDMDHVMDRLRAHRPIPWWKDKAMVQYLTDTLIASVDGSTPDSPSPGTAAGDAAWQLVRAVEGPASTRRRNRITDQRLDEVAEIYRNAPDRPTKAVEEQMFVSYSNAAYLVSRARAAGKIAPAVRGKPDPRK